MMARMPKLGMLLALTTIAVACEDDGTGGGRDGRVRRDGRHGRLHE